MAIRFTVFTPTYNRAHTLDRLYHSLQRQTFKDFEWIVIDDGSTDRTEERFTQILHVDNFFKITYQKVENGGKHRAINKAVKMAAGELFFIADSDDYLTDDALEIVDRVEKSIPEDKKTQFAGVCGLDVYTSGKLVGTTFEGNGFRDITSLQLTENGISGDRKEVFYTSILSAFPFPEFSGENFVPEAIVWHRIAGSGYKLRYFNLPVYVVEYQETGISNNYDLVQLRSPQSWALSIKEDIAFGLLKGDRIRKISVWYYRSLKNTLPFRRICDYLEIPRGKMLYYIVLERALQLKRRIVGR